jgi:hypothetical protein
LRRIVLRYWPAILALLAIVPATMAGISYQRDTQRHANEAWLDGVVGLTPAERTELSAFNRSDRDHHPLFALLKGWERCEKRYRLDAAAEALNDVRHHRAKPYWGHSGGYVDIEWVPGFEATCGPPLRPPGVNLPPEIASQRGNFRQLDQMGAEAEDGQMGLGLTRRCDRASRTYAATYNRALARVDAQAFRQCRAVPAAQRVSYQY